MTYSYDPRVTSRESRGSYDPRVTDHESLPSCYPRITRRSNGDEEQDLCEAQAWAGAAEDAEESGATHARYPACRVQIGLPAPRCRAGRRTDRARRRSGHRQLL